MQDIERLAAPGRPPRRPPDTRQPRRPRRQERPEAPDAAPDTRASQETEKAGPIRLDVRV
jgi:hypothetical protein